MEKTMEGTLSPKDLKRARKKEKKRRRRRTRRRGILFLILVLVFLKTGPGQAMVYQLSQGDFSALAWEARSLLVFLKEALASLFDLAKGAFSRLPDLGTWLSDKLDYIANFL
ncbi:MAG: hypothetical protein Q4E37_04010 [Tissierellia bacterium]|nr:hypothetical protein [Tissierellia bacterium]